MFATSFWSRNAVTFLLTRSYSDNPELKGQSRRGRDCFGRHTHPNGGHPRGGAGGITVMRSWDGNRRHPETRRPWTPTQERREGDGWTLTMRGERCRGRRERGRARPAGQIVRAATRMGGRNGWTEGGRKDTHFVEKGRTEGLLLCGGGACLPRLFVPTECVAPLVAAHGTSPHGTSMDTHVVVVRLGRAPTLLWCDQGKVRPPSCCASSRPPGVGVGGLL